MNHIFIDASYFIFYRVFALCVWWRNAKPEEPIDDPALNEEFVEKFKSTFVAKIKEMPKKLGLKKEAFLIHVGWDCPQNEIWRKAIFPAYKDGRNVEKNKQANIAYFFKLAIKEDLFRKAGVEINYRHDKLEADDCVYLGIQHLRETDKESDVFIISSDHDYLQIVDEKTKLIDLKYKNHGESKTSFGNADKDLFMKIVLGDKSDNISPIFQNKKIGKKTIEKLYEDKGKFYEMLSNDHDALTRFETNTILVDLKHIPSDLSVSFNKIHFNL